MALCDNNNASLSLLPDNATEFELKCEQIMLCKYLTDVDLITKLADPDTCPVEFLPWLAFANQVSARWNDALPESIKRKIIKNAKIVNHQKGTNKGLQDALDALGVKIKITHWYDMTPAGERGTMALDISVNENFNPDGSTMIDSQMLYFIEQAIQAHKRLSLHHSYKLGLGGGLNFAIAATAQISAIVNLELVTI